MDAASNSNFAVRPKGDICAVCWMQVNGKTAPSEVYKGQTYYFCFKGHQQVFDANPGPFIEQLNKP